MSWHNSAGPAWSVLWPQAAPGLADALRLLASMGWRLPLALRPASPTTFSPCGLAHPSPDAFCVLRRQLEGQRRRPHLHDGVLSRPCTTTGRLHQHPDRGATPPQPSAYPSLSTAPAGNTPVSRKRQSAMSNLRATATIPIRRKRLPPLPKRSRNHTLRALSGCKRSQLHANSAVTQRTCRLPDLVIPSSRAMCALWYGVGVKPAKPPTSRR